MTGEENIINKIRKDFETRFKKGSIINNRFNEQLEVIKKEISEEDNPFLTAEFTNAEIKKAIFNIGDDKSLGPDGMTAEFYKKYWDIVCPTEIKAIKSFFHHGRILKRINYTFITLIPKKDNPTSTNHYRPISLYSTIYKTISKLITERMKKVISKLIHPLQGAFVEKQAIHDNILIGHEIFHSFKQSKAKEGWMVTKLYMEKSI